MWGIGMLNNKFLSAVAVVMILFLSVGFCSMAEAARQKSTVLLVFNNQSGRDKGEQLDKKAYEELDKKINGIYNVVDNKPYAEKMCFQPQWQKRRLA